MAKKNFRLKPGALREIRQMPAVRDDLMRRAELIADRASEGGRVDGNFCAHAPVRMLDGVSNCHCLQLLSRPFSEGPSARGENDTPQSTLW